MSEPVPEPDVPCCPQLDPCEICDVLDLSYRVPFRPQVGDRFVPVTAVLRFEHRRCDGPLARGPLVFTQTLMPGERVRLTTQDRHSKFSFDSSTGVSNFHSSSSEESFYLSGFAQSTSDVDIVESARSNSTYHESAVSGGGGAGLDLGFFSIGGSVKGSSFDAESTRELTRSLSSHARSSHRHVSAGVRAASSVSISATNVRAHAEGESESSFEASSRTFHNPNLCHAVTYLFHQIVKCQSVEFALVGVDIHVADPQAPSVVGVAEPRTPTGLSVAPKVVAASDASLVETQRRAQQAAAERFNTGDVQATFALQQSLDIVAPDGGVKEEARRIVLGQLMDAGLVDQDGGVTDEARERYGWSDTLSLPTPGVMVRACLDECVACEDALVARQLLENRRLDLENQRLAREIDLMATDQEHRCCPGVNETGPPEGTPPGQQG